MSYTSSPWKAETDGEFQVSLVYKRQEITLSTLQFGVTLQHLTDTRPIRTDTLPCSQGYTELCIKFILSDTVLTTQAHTISKAPLQASACWNVRGCLRLAWAGHTGTFPESFGKQRRHASRSWPPTDSLNDAVHIQPTAQPTSLTPGPSVSTLSISRHFSEWLQELADLSGLNGLLHQPPPIQGKESTGAAYRGSHLQSQHSTGHSGKMAVSTALASDTVRHGLKHPNQTKREHWVKIQETPTAVPSLAVRWPATCSSHLGTQTGRLTGSELKMTLTFETQRQDQ